MEKETVLAKKRGPKASGVEKVVFYKRVTQEEKDAVEAFLAGKPVVANTVSVGIDPEREKTLQAEIKDLKRLLAQEQNEKKVALEAASLISERSNSASGVSEKESGNAASGNSKELCKQNMELAENVASLEVKLATLQGEYDELVAGNTDPALQKVRAELAKVKAHAKNLEQLVHG